MNYRQEVLKNSPTFFDDTVEIKLARGGLGTAGEAGEVADLIKKILFHGTKLEDAREKLIKEMGDVYWYLEYLGMSLGVSTEDVLAANVAKLKARHPQGWSLETAKSKADEK